MSELPQIPLTVAGVSNEPLLWRFLDVARLPYRVIMTTTLGSTFTAQLLRDLDHTASLYDVLNVFIEHPEEIAPFLTAYALNCEAGLEIVDELLKSTPVSRR